MLDKLQEVLVCCGRTCWISSGLTHLKHFPGTFTITGTDDGGVDILEPSALEEAAGTRRKHLQITCASARSLECKLAEAAQKAVQVYNTCCR
jgi:hypothetical protein